MNHTTFLNYFVLLCLTLAFTHAFKCHVNTTMIENPDFKCYPDLDGNEAEPSTICILDCKNNPIRYKHRCNVDGNWDIVPGSKSCDDLKLCNNPIENWGHWSWSCSLGHQVGSICKGTCNTNYLTSASIECMSDSTWKYEIDLDDPNICSQKKT